MRDNPKSAAMATPEMMSEARPDWNALVEGIQKKNGAAIEEFYATFRKSTSVMLYRRFGMIDLPDITEQCLALAVEAIQGYRLRDPARLPGYLQSIVRHYSAERIKGLIKARSEVSFDSVDIHAVDPSPEEMAYKAQLRARIREILHSMSSRDREILNRFYILGETAVEIQGAMLLSDTQFRLHKNRAKTRFIEAWHDCSRTRKPPGRTKASLLSKAG